ncbi:MAG: hypothetical protein QOD08_133 [Gaiellaceae bacterium]|jgi:hypothetical protein|nr:hypothetical protein [Gaiellaceae bacterium]MDX6517868.1 hypothetical protein [Gaiellaceae bacterium]
MPYLVAFSALGIVGVVLVIFLLTRTSGSTAPPPPVDFAALPGLQTGPPPWDNGLAGLDDRLRPLNMPQLTNEGQVVHIHQHLDIWVNGKKVPVPQLIGIQDSSYITSLHTHDPSGLIHVESPEQRRFNLGEFFGIWGVRLDKSCIASLCGNASGNGLKMWVNGQRYVGNPADLELKPHQEIAIVFGKPPAKIPQSYAFPPNT